MTPDVYTLLNVDPHGNHNNHDAVLIDRAVFRAAARLLWLENETIARIRAAALACKGGDA
jgi:hypothetical protein